MDIGVWMSRTVLAHKLECAHDGRSPEATWNVRKLPEGFGSSPGPHRLFVACEGAWRGYFKLADDVLWNPDDVAAPITLIFDARSWTPIAAVRVKRFRGLTAVTPPA
jgi:hypothetical protein